MPAFAVVTAFKGIDGVSKPLKKMSRSAKAFDKASDRAFSRASKRASMFGSVLKGVLGAQAITGGINLLRGGVSTLTEEFIGFDQAATSAAAKFPEGIKRGTAAFAKLGKTARDVGSTTKFTAAEAAGGLDFLAMAGFNAQQAMAALAPAAELAAVGNMDMARATDIATDTLGAFGLKVDDSIQLTKNMTRVNDVMAKTITTANVDMEQLFETMKFAGASAKNAGVEIEQFAAFTGTMGNAGIKASMAGTAMRQMFTRLAKPTGEADVLLKKLGVKLQDSKGDFLDVTEILGEFNKKTKDMGTKQRTAAIATVFGQRAISGISALLDAGTDNLKAYEQKLKDAGGTAKTMAAEMNKSLQNRLLKLKSAAIEVGFKFIDSFQDKIPGAIDSAIQAVGNFDVGKALDQIQRFGMFIDRTIKLVRDLEPFIWGIVAGFVAYKTVLIGILAVQAIKFFFDLAAVLRSGAVAQGALNLMMSANPIGAIVLAVGLLVTGIVLLYKNWDTVSEVMQEFWIDFKTVMVKMWDWFVKLLDNPFFAGIARMLNPFLEIPMLIIKNWEPVKKFLFEVWEILKSVGSAVVDGLKGAASFLGIGGDVSDTQATGINKSMRKAPNEKEVKSKTEIGFDGRITLAGAEPGSVFEGETRGAPPIVLEMAGQN
ncbi:phage tail tape measure protein [Candidatus Pacearchaeota archaeon]|nr:phage tail tape measure protein [Candidatus Pacearchaeota archaeon]